jgi:hypothetical protein
MAHKKKKKIKKLHGLKCWMFFLRACHKTQYLDSELDPHRH